MFQALISPIASLAGTWLEGKVSKAKAETEVKVARAKAEAKVYETEATSSMLNEQSLTSQMGESWKDEIQKEQQMLLTYIFSQLNVHFQWLALTSANGTSFEIPCYC